MEVCQPLTEVANSSYHAIQQLDHKLAALRQQYGGPHCQDSKPTNLS